MKVISCLVVSVAIIISSVNIGTAQKNSAENHTPGSRGEDIIWIQKILDNWNYVCKNELNIDVNPLSWIIFYDSSSAWHLNADDTILPAFEKMNDKVEFAGIKYSLIRIIHKDSVWVPDRPPIPLASFLTSAMPYSLNRKLFFMAPLPSLFHKLSTPDQATYLDFLFTGSNIHELTHTRQLSFVLPQLLEIHDSGNFTSLDDNTVENTFSKNERYKQLYLEESAHLWNAVFTTSTDSCIALVEKAFKLTQIRKREFFSGDNEGLGRADEVFLSLEGSAMWAQYRVMLKNAANPNERDLLSWLVQQSPASSQERGLALVLLIDKFSSDWKNDFFEKQLPFANTYLRSAMTTSSKNTRKY